MKPLTDRNGQPFAGTKAELVKHNNKLCKREARAKAPPVLELPLPTGTGEALYRVAKAAGYGDARELVSRLIHNADEALKNGDCQTFEAFTKVTVTIGNLDPGQDRHHQEENYNFQPVQPHNKNPCIS